MLLKEKILRLANLCGTEFKFLKVSIFGKLKIKCAEFHKIVNKLCSL